MGARLEGAAQERLSRALVRRGWRPAVLGFTGYGTTSWVRVLGRVLLRRRGEPSTSTGETRGWRSFLALDVPEVAVTVEVGGVRQVVTSDRDGYIDMVIPCTLSPGWHEAHLGVADSTPVVAPVRVVSPRVGVGLVSDVDDTVLDTALPRPLLAFWNTFILREHARRPVPGMAKFYASVLAAYPDAPVLYLSTGAWEVAPTLTRFLATHGLPPGPLLLTDWGPAQNSWFRDGRAHKRQVLARLVTEFPEIRWLLVGDDGQADPELYGELVRTEPRHVLAVAIRALSPVRKALATSAPTLAHPGAMLGTDRHRSEGPRGIDTVWVTGPDGDALLAALREHDLIRPPPALSPRVTRFGAGR
jgi:phosphatidate phosphatase APP1